MRFLQPELAILVAPEFLLQREALAMKILFTKKLDNTEVLIVSQDDGMYPLMLTKEQSLTLAKAITVKYGPHNS